MREAEALVQEGLETDVLALRCDDSKAPFEVLNGVNVHRVPIVHKRGKKSGYLMRYGRVFFWAFFRLTAWTFRGNLKLVHIHNMPDFLVFAAIVPRLAGVKIILDLHDPMPELYGSLFAAPKEQFGYRMLRLIERCSIAFADKVVTPNIAFKRLFDSRSAAAGKVDVIMNSPDSALFDSEKAQESIQRTGARNRLR